MSYPGAASPATSAPRDRRPGRHVIVVGASLAGLRTAEALRTGGYDGTLTIVGEEGHEPYDRPPLSKSLLSGSTTAALARLPLQVDPEHLAADWHLGHRATGLDLPGRELQLDDGRRLPFDGLVVATGGRARRLPCTTDVSGVHVLRTLADAERLRDQLSRHPRVVVIGAGFIGSEVAATARSLELDVTLVDAAPVPMHAAVGEFVGRFCARLHQRHGVRLRLGTAVDRLESAGGQLRAVHLRGTRLPCDLAVLGLGAVPNVEWLLGSGVLLDNGLRTDAALRVLDLRGAPVPAVVAAGDCVRWPHPTFDDSLVRVEHWSNAVDQAGAAARTLLQELTTPEHPQPPRPPSFAGVPSFWSDQYDARILSVGLPALATTSAVLDGSLADGRFVVGYGRRQRLVGAVAVNCPRPLAGYRRHILDRSPWPPAAGERTSRPHGSPTIHPTQSPPGMSTRSIS